MKALIIAACSVIFLGLGSCSKKGDSSAPPTTTQKGQTAKFTFTVNNFPTLATSQEGIVNIAIGAIDPANSSNQALWKINGVSQGNQAVISIDASSFSAGTSTIVVESQVPLIDISADITFIPWSPVYSVTYTPVINGVTVQSDALNNVSVTNTIIKDFTYNAQ